MKRTFNLTTYSDDLDRYRDRADLLSALRDFDGLELMHCGEDVRGIVPPEKIVGVHLCFFPYWYDFYTGDMAACARNLGGVLLVNPGALKDGRCALITIHRGDVSMPEMLSL